MIKTVYFDMDRVLCDFEKQAVKYRVIKKNEKINWIRVGLIGSRYWSTMDWFPNAKNSFFRIKEKCIDLGISIKILSSVKLISGRIGKKIWCKKNLQLSEKDIILVSNAHKKSNYANENTLLIDDNFYNICDFMKECGKTVQLIQWNSDTIEEIMKMITSI